MGVHVEDMVKETAKHRVLSGSTTTFEENSSKIPEKRTGLPRSQRTRLFLGHELASVSHAYMFEFPFCFSIVEEKK